MRNKLTLRRPWCKDCTDGAEGGGEREHPEAERSTYDISGIDLLRDGRIDDRDVWGIRCDWSRSCSSPKNKFHTVLLVSVLS